MNAKLNPEELDPRLKEMLDAYRQAPERDPEAVERGRAKFMAELDTLFDEQLQPRPSTGWLSLLVWAAHFNSIKENLAMSFLHRSALTTITTLIVVLAFLFGGAGVTAFAANSSLPGDALYSLKTSLESTRAGLSGNLATQARLYLEFAGRRLTEIQTLIEQGRFSDIAQATAEFEKYIQQALAAVQALAETDPAQAAALNLEISQTLASYSATLTQMLASVPADVQPLLQGAADASQSSDDNGNSNDDGNANDDNSNDDDGNDNDDNTNDDDGNDNDDNSNDDDGNDNDDNSNDDDGNDNDDNSNDDDGNDNDDNSNDDDANDNDDNSNDDDGNDNDDNTNDDDGGNTNDDDGGGNSNDDDGGNTNDDGGNTNDDDGGGNTNDDDGNSNDD